MLESWNDVKKKPLFQYPSALLDRVALSGLC